jgi:cytoskeletal protein RodZ
MTDPEAPRSGGVHRRPARRRRLAVLLVSLVVIAAIAVGVHSILRSRGEPASAPADAAAASHASSQRATATPTSTPSPTPSPTPSLTPASTPTPSPSPSATASARPPVDVLNDSRVTHLAADSAAEFRAGGWVVATIGNYSSETDVPETTLFYPDGEKAAARAFADQFGIGRVLPASSGISGTHLSVVLARDWAAHVGAG